MQYFKIYEQLRLLEEFVCLLMNPEIEEQQIQHLQLEMRDLMRQNVKHCAITIKNSRYAIGNPEFYFSEIKYVNQKIF